MDVLPGTAMTHSSKVQRSAASKELAMPALSACVLLPPVHSEQWTALGHVAEEDWWLLPSPARLMLPFVRCDLVVRCWSHHAVMNNKL